MRIPMLRAWTVGRVGAGLLAMVVGAGPSVAGDATDTALGAFALPATTGHGNTAVGFGALFGDTVGSYNTAVGAHTLSSTTSGQQNTAVGVNALYTNTADFNTAVGVNALVYSETGTGNTAMGAGALLRNVSGQENVAVGIRTLPANVDGDFNIAVGSDALSANVSGQKNVAVGVDALKVATGHQNIGIGTFAGNRITTGTNNIDIGNTGDPNDGSTAPATIRIGDAAQGRTFIAGIIAVVPPNTTVPVLINGDGQLGTTASSRRVKDDIQEMGAASDALRRLRPVTFRYRQPHTDGTRPVHYGLIAEEVAEVYPELVARTAEGEPWTVLYHELPAMLLNEWQRQAAVVEQQGRDLTALRAENLALRRQLVEELATLQGRLAELTTRLAPQKAAEPTQAWVASQ